MWAPWSAEIYLGLSRVNPITNSLLVYPSVSMAIGPLYPGHTTLALGRPSMQLREQVEGNLHCHIPTLEA